MSKLSLTGPQAKAIDRLARQRYGLSTLALMENAGSVIARHACAEQPAGRIAVVCGKGNNGGDGFVAARHLRSAGRKVEVYAVCPPGELRGEAKINAGILSRCGQKIAVVSGRTAARHIRRMASADLIVDALLGIGLNACVRGVYRQLIEQINASGCRTLSVDMPSGLDADSGAICGACVQADTTITFIAPKAGMLKAEGPRMCGRVIVEPIGFPLEKRFASDIIEL